MADDTDVVFTTSLGNFVVELYNQATPLTVANFLSYVENPTAGDNYDDNFFHRLVKGFVLQGGGYTIQNGTVDTIPTGAPVASEASASYPNVEGSIAMALSSGPNSATDEFFINLGDNSSLLDGTSDGGPFTVFGQVVENFSVVQAIANLPTVDISGSAVFTQLPIQGSIVNNNASLDNLVEYSVALVQPIAGTGADQPVLDDATDTPFATVTLTDPGNASGAGDAMTIIIENASGTPSVGLGTLSLPAGAAAGGLSLTSANNGTYTLSAAPSLAVLQAALESLVFTPTPLSSATPVTVTFGLTLDSPGGTLDNQDTSVVVSPDTAREDTIVGADDVTRALTFATGAQGALAAPLLAGVEAANALFVDAPGVYAMAAGQTAAIDDAAGAVSISGNSGTDETIAAGAGALSFTAGADSGTIVAGSGNDFVLLPGGGSWFTSLGNGADTVVAATGNDTVATGTAGGFVFLGAGKSSVASAGADTILGGTGSATVQATGANGDEVFSLGAPMAFLAGAGASTVVTGAVFTALIGGASGGTLAFSDGSTYYTGGGATDTVVGLAGSLSVQGGAGGGLFYGGTEGDNVITAGAGNTTAFGGGAGDVLTATGSASDLFAGGPGAETLTGAGSSGANTFFAGFGPQTLIGGAGNTALVAGVGADLFQGGVGVTLFLFVAGETAGATDTITGWNPSHDFVKLAGYAGSEASTVANATNSAAGTTIALSDGTSILFAGVAQLNATSFT